MPRFILALPSDRRHLPLLAFLGVALVLLVSVFYIANIPIKVDGDSMYPTLHHGDRVLVSRGYDTPQRGDIVSFSAVISGERDTLMKRVVAIAGDTVEVHGDSILVNGIAEQGGYPISIGAETFRVAPLVVPEGHVYVAGDNRPFSLDSRFFGPVSIADIRGEAFYRYSPVTRLGRIDYEGGRP